MPSLLPSRSDLFSNKAEVLLPVVLFVVSFGVAFAGYRFGPLALFGILAAMFGLPVALITFFDIKKGITIVIILSFTILGVKRIVGDVPLGLMLDGLILFLALSTLFHLLKNQNWHFAANPVSFAILIWIIYNLLEVLNPWAASKQAWMYTVRSMAGFMVFYFVVLYAIDRLSFATFIIKLWIALSLAAAIHGFNQEFIGFLPFEDQWVHADMERFALLFQMGRFRKFSFMSDAMIFGFVMAYSSILCFVLFLGPHSLFRRIALFIAGSMMAVAMIYSGTRAAYVLIPVGFFFYIVMTLERRMVIGAIVFLFLGVIFVNMPVSNINLIRLQSAFKPGEDASYNTRKRNQKMIQPFLWSHPIGGGLGSTGDWGEKFSPGSFLSKFPPDSGYMRIVVEMGPVGLALYLYLMFTVLSMGIKNYFIISDPKLKNLMLALLCVIFSLLIANFPQEATSQIPNSLLLYVMFAVVTKMPEFENKEMLKSPSPARFSKP